MSKRCNGWILPNGQIPGVYALDCDKPQSKRHGIWHEATHDGIRYRWARGGGGGLFRVSGA